MMPLICGDAAGGPLVPPDPAKKLVMVNGQSNAIFAPFGGIHGSIVNALTNSPPPGGFDTGVFGVGGAALTNWVNLAGTGFGPYWTQMMAVFDQMVADCAAANQDVDRIHLVYFQGESDAFSVGGGNPTSFCNDQFPFFVQEFLAYGAANWPVTPTVTAALPYLVPNSPEAIANPTWGPGMDIVRACIQTVMTNAGQSFFDTAPLSHSDYVHLDAAGSADAAQLALATL